MRPGTLSLVALSLAIASTAADGLLLHVPAVRNGWWAAIPMALALGLAMVAFCRRRAWTTIVPGAVVILLTGITIGSHFLPVPKTPPIVKQGDAFPDIRLAAHDETRVWLSDRWRRAPLVVVMFRGKWWMICHAEMRGLRNAYPAFKDAGADLVAISVDSPEENRAFAHAAQLPFTLLSDPERELVKKLGILHERGGPGGSDISTPATYVLDRDGKVVWMHRSSDVRTRPDPAEMLAVVKSLK